MSARFRNFADLYLYFKFSSFTNFKVHFLVNGFFLTSPCHKLKKRGRVYSHATCINNNDKLEPAF